jgi:hypothetical protein
MSKPWTLTALAVVPLLLTSAPASAFQQHCAPPTELTSILRSDPSTDRFEVALFAQVSPPDCDGVVEVTVSDPTDPASATSTTVEIRDQTFAVIPIEAPAGTNRIVVTGDFNSFEFPDRSRPDPRCRRMRGQVTTSIYKIISDGTAIPVQVGVPFSIVGRNLGNDPSVP